ncbi:MAG: hypothetical protein A2898_03435 [Candidatus Kerfeldbacteria bacterium RIFCSPLOWO2_01_FULL_48_11]|uniref:histidine kinase n=1 Tax=Candidatus Kerfeldbacteria bacterium RIFCSPLOWO2_01_FULL_48_11 TaxID=1798543 RepID=A0A1G2B2C7_9BACT|nr:MAG: hypothetical protein A2898_03435 [Candidatus Kerfeldbacteria bacterium RIFCSPLOWO2_01_FULL_48_11]HCM68554.1 hypothetical protein [Candidatus Kerfeldbacteria bacterium]
MTKISIYTKFGFILGFFMIIAVANFIVISYSQGTQKTDAAIIDTAGRQRMFSQQLAFYAERIVRGHTASKVTLKKVITLYQDSLTVLKNGGVAPEIFGNRTIPPTVSSILPVVQRVEMLWREYKTNAEIIIREPTSTNGVENELVSTALAYIEQNAPEMLLRNNELVVAYVQMNDAKQSQMNVILLVLLIVDVAVFGLGAWLILLITKKGEVEKAHTEEMANDLVKFKLAVNYSYDHIVITDAEGIILYANQAVQRITGFPLEEMMGKKVGNSELWGGQMPEVFYQELWKRIKHEKKAFIGQINNRRKNGETYHAQVTISPVLDNSGEVEFFVGIERDLTERLKYEEQLRMFNRAVESSTDGVLISLPDTTVIYINPTWERLTGYSRNEVVGKKADMLKSGEMSQEEHKRLWVSLNAKETYKSETFVNRRKDGTTYNTELAIYPVVVRDKTEFYVVLQEDITKRIEIDRAKTEFVSIASHQLRTPLSAVNWYAEMILAGDVGKVTGMQKKYLQEIYSGNQRMVALVNALLNVSHIDLGTLAIEPQPTNINFLIADVQKELQPLIKARRVKVHATFEEKMPKAPLDPKLIRIVFQNLISNAVKYTPPGGVISIVTELQKDGVLFSISDTGYGIPAQQQNKIFTKLFRADNIRGKDANGTGLGLYIVKSIVNLSGGKVWFTSTENKGTTFYVTIPFTGMTKKVGTKGLT